MFELDLGFYNWELFTNYILKGLLFSVQLTVIATVGGIVVGTGNKVEDFGVGFFTKYGDGGVDISPIGDCMKTEVWDMGRELGLLKAIIDAPPTDGLWADDRNDEDHQKNARACQITQVHRHGHGIAPRLFERRRGLWLERQHAGRIVGLWCRRRTRRCL